MPFQPTILTDFRYDIFENNSSGGDPLTRISRLFKELGVRLMRDVTVGWPMEHRDLCADPGDFWYHTDGCFLAQPPKWVVVQLLRADKGGAIHALDCTEILALLPKENLWFGTTKTGTIAPIVSEEPPDVIVRYRRDYMRPLSSPEILTQADNLITQHAARRGVYIGELCEGDCLLINNSVMLHRREPFSGARVIRRLWFG